MSAAAAAIAPIYLREARIAAGYSSRDTAATKIPYSPETIGRHERGQVPIAPDDAIVYARGYGRDDILIRYCAQCPVGKAQGRRATDRALPFATLRLTHRLRRAAKEIADTLERIADDGIIDDDERPAFDDALSTLKELDEAITDMVLYAATQGHGKRKESSQKGATPNNRVNYSSGCSVCQAKNQKNQKKRKNETQEEYKEA